MLRSRPAAWAAAVVVVAAGATVVDWSSVAAAGRTVARDPLPLVVALAAYTLAFALRALSWAPLLPVAVPAARRLQALFAMLAVNHALPGPVGEVARARVVTGPALPLRRALLSVAAARVVDVGSVALLLLVGAWASGGVPAWARVGAPLGVLLPVVALGVARRRGALLSAGQATRVAALALPSWALECGVLWAVARAAGIDLSVPEALLATCAGVLAQVAAVLPGGIGTYEAGVTSALVVVGVPVGPALAVAASTHAVKFAYAFAVGVPALLLPHPADFGAREAAMQPLVHQSRAGVRPAGPLEVVAARCWNVLNEGKPFTPVFTLGVLVLTGVRGAGLLAAVPLALVWWRHSYPLHLRAALWAVAAGVVVAAGGLPIGPALVGLGLYVLFTVGIWGTLYYHLRLGAPWTNFTRFWRLVAENPDPTSGNLVEQVPKIAALLAVAHSTRPVPLLLAATAAALVVGEVVHRRFVTWVPGRATGNRRADRRPQPAGPPGCGPPSRKVLLVVIDGCRADRLAEADTPFLDRLAGEGMAYADCETVYPARTVTCFTSMLTGAPPAVHGMRSNFVPSLGAKCESIFDVVPRSRLVGIAHLIDSFGDRVASVTAVMPNDAIDRALCDRARQVVEEDDPDLLVVQTLSVDQAGHVRGSYHDEYVARIEATDREVERLVGWLADRWGGLDGVTIGVLSDHGQGIGIGGHGHWTEPERVVPCIWWGRGVPAAPLRSDVSVLDVAPTLAHRMGVDAPRRSIGSCLLCSGDRAADRAGDDDGAVTVVLPVCNEASTLTDVIAAVPRRAGGRRVDVVVVDDGSTDGSADLALAAGAKVLAHDGNRGLGAALRTGLAHARDTGAWAAVFLDADGEYDPAQLPDLLAPIERGAADYVVGSRFRGTITAMLRRRRAGNHALTLFTSLLARRRLSDAQSGFRALSRDALRVVEIAHDYNYAQVLTLDLLGKGFRYAEVPITYRRRRNGRSFVTLGRYVRRVVPAMVRAARTR